MSDDLDVFSLGGRHIIERLTDDARPGLPDDVPPPVAVVFPSKSGGDTPHVVSRTVTGDYRCTCVAGSHDRTCWAVTATKELLRR